MNFEVEQKFPVDSLAVIAQALGERNVSIAAPRAEVDLYFAHPQRDFAKTDEALRLRRIGLTNRITYKGPKLDAQTKTRQEIELDLGEGEAAFEQWKALLEALGFRPVAHVHKRRRKAHLTWQFRQVEVSLDEVEGVGTFVELETMAGQDDLDAARRAIADLARQLGLSQTERRSYLELLLDSQRPTAQ